MSSVLFVCFSYLHLFIEYIFSLGICQIFFEHFFLNVNRADVGDFIIKGVAGELYPCKPDIFEKTYERL